MSVPNLPVNFKDDILAASNPKRKYQQTYNTDGSVSLEDVTVYTQQGSDFGASQVNQTNQAINNIYSERILDLDELELVTEPGFFVDAQAAKEAYDALNSNTYKSVEVPPNAQYKKYTIGDTTVVIGTLVATSPEDYVKIFSIQNLKDFFGDDVVINRISLTTWNGDANTAPVRFYAPELWNNDGVYQYFYPARSGDVRVNYRAEYVKL